MMDNKRLKHFDYATIDVFKHVSDYQLFANSVH
jgi:hypothetical protein